MKRTEREEVLAQALIDALIDAREFGGESSGWYSLAVDALAVVGYDEYGNVLPLKGAK